MENKQSSKSSLFSVPGCMMMCARRLGKETSTGILTQKRQNTLPEDTMY